MDSGDQIPADSKGEPGYEPADSGRNPDLHQVVGLGLVVLDPVENLLGN